MVAFCNTKEISPIIHCLLHFVYSGAVKCDANKWYIFLFVDDCLWKFIFISRFHGEHSYLTEGENIFQNNFLK